MASGLPPGFVVRPRAAGAPSSSALPPGFARRPRTDANARISGAFEVAAPVRQVKELVEPRSGLVTSRNRLGDVSLGGALGDIWGATETVGDVYRGRRPAMVPDTGQGVTNPEVETAAKTLAAAVLPMNPAVRAGDRAIPGVLRNVQKIVAPAPTRQELAAAGSGGFTKAFGMGVDFDPKAMAQFASEGRAILDKKYFNEKSAPNTFEQLRQLENPQGPYHQLSDLEEFRRQLYRGATSDADRNAAAQIAERVDRFMEEPPAASVMVGPTAAKGPAAQKAYKEAFYPAYSKARKTGFSQQEAAKQADTVARQSAGVAARGTAEQTAVEAGGILKDARGNWAALERSKELAGREKTAIRRAKATGMGFNIDNNLRLRVTSLLEQVDKGQLRGFSPSEIASMEEFAAGTKGRNAIRFLANKLGAGNALSASIGSMGSIAAAVATGSPLPLMAPLPGLAMKGLQNVTGKRALTAVDEAVRMRSPLYGTRTDKITPLPITKQTVRTRTLGVGSPDSLPIPYGQDTGTDEPFPAGDAEAAGRSFVSMGLDNASARRVLAKMPAKERERFTRGFASELIAQMQGLEDRTAVLDEAFVQSGNSRQRIEMALGPQRARQIEAFLRIEQLVQQPAAADTITAAGMRYGIDGKVAQNLGTMLTSGDPQAVLKGVRIIARNEKLLKFVRTLNAASPTPLMNQ